jgi:hypothetical protein
MCSRRVFILKQIVRISHDSTHDVTRERLPRCVTRGPLNLARLQALRVALSAGGDGKITLICRMFREARPIQGGKRRTNSP